jgi:hypothetical protein
MGNTQRRCVAGQCIATTCGALNQNFCTDANSGNAYCLTNADTVSDPANCGGCGIQCQPGEVCAQGTCSAFVVSPACNTCPCTDCDNQGLTCCTYPGDKFAICVFAAACP